MQLKIVHLSAYSTVFLMMLLSCRNDTSYQDLNFTDRPLPQLLRLDGNGKSIAYFGTYHSNDINDSLFYKIRSLFINFNPDFVLHEGGSNWPIYQSIDSTVLISGEPGFVIKLSIENSIPFESIEPSIKDEFKNLRRSYSKQDIVLMYICRQIDQQQRMDRASNISDSQFELSMVNFLKGLSRSGIELDADENRWQYWQATYETTLGEKLVWRQFDPAIYYPNYNKTRLNEVSRDSDSFRNEFMIKKIINSLSKYDKVMIVVGGGHLFLQEEKLKIKFNESIDEF